jgi:hypothetical protein
MCGKAMPFREAGIIREAAPPRDFEAKPQRKMDLAGKPQAFRTSGGIAEASDRIDGLELEGAIRTGIISVARFTGS